MIAPDPVTCFAAARYEQQQQFVLDDSASLVLIDSLCSGRVAHGERWAFSRYRSSNEILLAGPRAMGDNISTPHFPLSRYSGGGPGWGPMVSECASGKIQYGGATPPPPQPSPGVPGEGEGSSMIDRPGENVGWVYPPTSPPATKRWASTPTLQGTDKPHPSLSRYRGGGRRRATPLPPQSSHEVPGDEARSGTVVLPDESRTYRRIFRDALLLDPLDGPLNHPQRLGRFDCLAMALLIGPRVLAAAEAMLSLISSLSPGVDPATGLLVSASPLRVDGVLRGGVLRVAGASSESVMRFMRAQLEFLSEPLGEDPWKRKW